MTARRGLVLGGGGVLGLAWMVGALSALEQAEGFSAASADAYVGTSAGSVVAAFLGAGVEVATMLSLQRGQPVEGSPAIDYDYATETTAGPPRPGVRVGSPALLRRVVRRPWRYPPLIALSALAPPGRASIEQVGRLVGALLPDGGWVPHRATWIVAMDYQTGQRVAFGRPDAPAADLGDAVMASCAIPGWYTPVQIGDRQYVDGGTCSPTSADLLLGSGLAEVFVLAPMTSFEYDAPTAVAARVERQLRRGWTRQLRREVSLLRRTGTRVVVLAPGRADLEVMGGNLMDPARRAAVLETSLRTSAAALARA